MARRISRTGSLSVPDEVGRRLGTLPLEDIASGRVLPAVQARQLLIPACGQMKRGDGKATAERSAPPSLPSS
ncbi:MAG: hypothetical protein RMM58_10480 [Chloroflexota bacterium]|nr:hypothetical protein [Chloroflexota bacterium]